MLLKTLKHFFILKIKESAFLLSYALWVVAFFVIMTIIGGIIIKVGGFEVKGISDFIIGSAVIGTAAVFSLIIAAASIFAIVACGFLFYNFIQSNWRKAKELAEKDVKNISPK